jgi:predicted nucleic acid-binding protein
MKYLLDTNIVSYLSDPASRFHTSVEHRFSRLQEEDVIFISVLTLFEIEYGIVYAPQEKKKRMEEVKQMLQHFLAVLPVQEKQAGIFGALKAGYRKLTGVDHKTIDRHDVDFMLASSALAENAVLVSNDKIFVLIQKAEPTLKLGNWTV